MTSAADPIGPATGPARRTAVRTAWTAVALAIASAANTIVAATIVATRSYERFVPDSSVPKSTLLRMYARAAIERMTIYSCVVALATIALAVAALSFQKTPGAVRCKPVAVWAIVLALASAVAAGIVDLACGWQLAPWSFG
jgi:hypothetical protein